MCRASLVKIKLRCNNHDNPLPENKGKRHDLKISLNITWYVSGRRWVSSPEVGVPAAVAGARRWLATRRSRLAAAASVLVTRVSGAVSRYCHDTGGQCDLAICYIPGSLMKPLQSSHGKGVIKLSDGDSLTHSCLMVSWSNEAVGILKLMMETLPSGVITLSDSFMHGGGVAIR